VKESLFRDDASTEAKELKKHLESELHICKDLRRPHIVSYLGHEYTDFRLDIYLEYVPGGSLNSFLEDFGRVDGRLLNFGVRSIVEGLSYLHTRSPPVVHRNIKGASVLVDLNFCLKLADFGLSKRSHDTATLRTVGSIPRMAPEVILQAHGHGRKADVWTLGCTSIEMATAEKPWGKDAFENQFSGVRQICFIELKHSVPEHVRQDGDHILAGTREWRAEDLPFFSRLPKRTRTPLRHPGGSESSSAACCHRDHVSC